LCREKDDKNGNNNTELRGMSKNVTFDKGLDE